MDGVGSGLTVSARIVAGLLALGVGGGALAIARGSGNATTYAGRSSTAAALTLGAGLTLAAAGLLLSGARRRNRIANLAMCAAVVWFAPVWIAWRDGPALVRSVATVLSGFTFPLVLHLVLTYPTGRAASKPVRVIVGLVYLEAALTAIVLALFRDPYFDSSCLADCTVNSFLIASRPMVAHDLVVADRWFVEAAAFAFAAFCIARLATASRLARARQLPIAVPGIAFAGTVVARQIRLHRVAIEDPFDGVLFRVFVIGCVAIILLASGLTWSVLRAHAERRALARIVAELHEAPPPGFLQTALAEALHDPHLGIAYPLPDAQRYVDANGREAPEPAATPGHTITRLTRHGRPIAVISHSAAVAELGNQLGPALRLGLDNERLQAEVLAQVEELRDSRARIVETADLERRGLERDLHDGAQQYLLALSYDIRLAQASAQASGDTATLQTLARAVEQATAALEELRQLARGIYPAVLSDAGLLPALASLADTAPVPVEILAAPRRRFAAAIETAAYFAVAEAVEDAAQRHADHAALTITQPEGCLTLTLVDDGSRRSSPMTALADRVGALGGTLHLEPTTCRVELPCG